MKIGLYNVDSKYPNLALMKIAAWYKGRGDEVAWCGSPIEAEEFDKVYGSQIFTDSKAWYAANLEMGGSGYSRKVKLPDEIDKMDPDYAIYPEYTDSIGFTTRGCIRNCPFCYVPKMEGEIREYRKVEEVYRGGDLILLDNNILALEGKFEEVLTFCRRRGVKVEFNQGLDVRLMSDRNVGLFLDNLKIIIKPKFAFDDLNYRAAVEKFCKKIEHIGRKVLWYVYADEDWESALERCLVLKRYNQKPYLMRDKRVAKDKKYVVLAHWTNNVVGGFWKHDFWEHMEWYKNR